MKTRVLLLAATPQDEDSLRVDEEFREIKAGLRYGKDYDNFEIHQGGV